MWWCIRALVGERVQMCGGFLGEKEQKQVKMGAKECCDRGRGWLGAGGMLVGEYLKLSELIGGHRISDKL